MTAEYAFATLSYRCGKHSAKAYLRDADRHGYMKNDCPKCGAEKRMNPVAELQLRSFANRPLK